MRRRLLLLAAAAIGCEVAFAQVQALPVEQAFRLRVRRAAPRTIELLWIAAPGTHLYRDRFNVAVKGAPVAVTAVDLPPAKTKFDRVLGKDMEYFEGAVLMRVAYAGPAVPFTLVASAQGCAEAAGICYVPVVHELDIGGVPP